MIEIMLQDYVAEKPSKWEQHLPLLELSNNSSKHVTSLDHKRWYETPLGLGII